MLFHATRVPHARRSATPPVAALVAGDGPAVLLVHGWTGFKESWGPLLPAIAAAGMRAVALDLPGCGASPRGPRGGHSPEGLAEALARVVDAERPAGVVAHSFGVQVAVLALRRAGAVPRLALIAPAALPWPRRRTPPRGLADLVRVPFVGPPLARVALRRMRRDPARRVAAYRTALVDPDALAGDPAMRALLADAADRLARADVGVLVEWLGPALDGDLREAARGLGAPALVVCGARDRVVPPGGGAALARALRGARLLTAPGAGHFPHLERADLVVPAITGHLAGRAP